MKILSADFVMGIRGTNPIMDEPLPHISFIGRSNVGKSSLINMLLERKSLVKSSSKPGKTREINFFLVNEEYYFVDLPGYGYAKLGKQAREKLWKLINWYLDEQPGSERILILVLDAKVGITDFDREILDRAISDDHSLVVVVNKIDKLSQKEKNKILNEVTAETSYPVVLASAVKKKGREEFFTTVFE